MTDTRQWMETLKLKAELRGLRRSALAKAREIIKASPESENMSPEEIDMAAHGLFETQFKTLKTSMPGSYDQEENETAPE